MSSSIVSSPLSQSHNQNSAIGWLNRRYGGGNFYIRECQFGLGVFACQTIGRGGLILVIEGPLIDFAETKRRGPRECMAVQVGSNRYIDTQPPGVFVNHSCDPNAGIKQDRYLVALRKIAKDEEIFFDYSTTMEEQSFTMECFCGAPGCRKIVQDFSTLPGAVQDRYVSEGIVMGFIQAKMRSWRAGEIVAPVSGTLPGAFPEANMALLPARQPAAGALGRGPG